MKESSFMLPPYLADPLEPISNRLNNIPTGRCIRSKRYDKYNNEIPNGAELPANIIIKIEKPEDEPVKTTYIPENHTDTDSEPNLISLSRSPTIRMTDLFRYGCAIHSSDHSKLAGENPTDGDSS